MACYGGEYLTLAPDVIDLLETYDCSFVSFEYATSLATISPSTFRNIFRAKTLSLSFSLGSHSLTSQTRANVPVVEYHQSLVVVYGRSLLTSPESFDELKVVDVEFSQRTSQPLLRWTPCNL
jgi:hypothetical protein